PQLEHAVAENWQVLSASRRGLVHWFREKPYARPCWPDWRTATESAVPSPYSPCPLPPDVMMWCPYSWWDTLANEVLVKLLEPMQKLIPEPSYSALPGQVDVLALLRLTLTGKFVCVEMTG